MLALRLSSSVSIALLIVGFGGCAGTKNLIGRGRSSSSASDAEFAHGPTNEATTRRLSPRVGYPNSSQAIATNPPQADGGRASAQQSRPPRWAGFAASEPPEVDVYDTSAQNTVPFKSTNASQIGSPPTGLPPAQPQAQANSQKWDYHSPTVPASQGTTDSVNYSTGW